MKFIDYLNVSVRKVHLPSAGTGEYGHTTRSTFLVFNRTVLKISQTKIGRPCLRSMKMFLREKKERKSFDSLTSEIERKHLPSDH
jgi:hypothetical protein